jgi:hypothetical protein
MKDVLKKKLPEELYPQVIAALGDDFDFVPRTRLNEVIGQRDELKSQLTAVKSKADQYDDLVASKTALETALADAKAQHLAEIAAKDQAINQVKVESTVKEKLLINKVKNPTAAMALLKVDAFGDDLAGLDAEITRIKESDPYLFGDSVPGGTGKEDGIAGSAQVGEVEQLQAQHAEALKSGNIANAIAIKNKMFDLVNKK